MQTIEIKGQVSRYEDGKFATKECDLYMLGRFDAEGKLNGYVHAGRPSTVRVYDSLEECKNGIRGNKRFYKHVTLMPVRILTGEVVQL